MFMASKRNITKHFKLCYEKKNFFIDYKKQKELQMNRGEITSNEFLFELKSTEKKRSKWYIISFTIFSTNKNETKRI